MSARSEPRRGGWRRDVVAVAIAGLVAGCSSSDGEGAATTAAGGERTAGEQYCLDAGGMLVERVATWNTNADPPAWLQLAGRTTFCEFERGDGDQTTRISVDLVTLSSQQPTLAAIAYLSDVHTTQPARPSANPAQFSCREDFGGASAFGSSAAGGGWVDTSQPTFVVMDMCVFPDLSAIDAFGLWYHANGVVRGADLAAELRYQPGDELPAIFPASG
jgi:hypothetical protein